MTAPGVLVVRPGPAFGGMKVFCAATSAERQGLGERVTAWLAADPMREIVEFVVLQSSDRYTHCVSIVAVWRWACESTP